MRVRRNKSYPCVKMQQEAMSTQGMTWILPFRRFEVAYIRQLILVISPESCSAACLELKLLTCLRTLKSVILQLDCVSIELVH